MFRLDLLLLLARTPFVFLLLLVWPPASRERLRVKLVVVFANAEGGLILLMEKRAVIAEHPYNTYNHKYVRSYMMSYEFPIRFYVFPS